MNHYNETSTPAEKEKKYKHTHKTPKTATSD
jgi:hypothetical protein